MTKHTMHDSVIKTMYNYDGVLQKQFTNHTI